MTENKKNWAVYGCKCDGCGKMLTRVFREPWGEENEDYVGVQCSTWDCGSETIAYRLDEMDEGYRAALDRAA